MTSPWEEECYIHGYEPLTGYDYRVCGECGHAFRTEQDLIDADMSIQQKAYTLKWSELEPKELPPEEIYACPLCAHDF